MSHINRVSFDLETLGLSTDAVLLQLGAAFIDYEGSTFMFQHTASVASQSNRIIDPNTVAWWNKQAPNVRAQVLDPANDETAPSLRTALIELTTWLNTFAKGFPLEVYGNGAAFDLGMLNHAYRQVGLATPWHFRCERDQRTLEALASAAGCAMAYDVDRREGDHHTAGSDAVYQARRIHRLWSELLQKLNA